jgi:hypothetical protein
MKLGDNNILRNKNSFRAINRCTSSSSSSRLTHRHPAIRTTMAMATSQPTKCSHYSLNLVGLDLIKLDSFNVSIYMQLHTRRSSCLLLPDTQTSSPLTLLSHHYTPLPPPSFSLSLSLSLSLLFYSCILYFRSR